MKLSAAFLPLLSALAVLASPVAIEQRGIATSPGAIEKRGISTSVYDDLLWYFKYASSSYNSNCPKPNGNTLVKKINNERSDTQGYVARDDSKKEIIVALRGSSSIIDWVVTDISVALRDFSAPGVSAPGGTKAHAGFTKAWNSVASTIIASVQAELSAHPDYTIIASGHSLGGSLASLAAITLKENFPDTSVRLYTYGQPRTGNPTFAAWLNDAIGKDNIFRVVHTKDLVPHLIPPSWGYRHHATEYWQTPDPASAATTTQCDDSGEDRRCSWGAPGKNIGAHSSYFNMATKTPFCS